VARMSDQFPIVSVRIAIRDVLRWLIEYEPPHGEASGGHLTVVPKEPKPETSNPKGKSNG